MKYPESIEKLIKSFSAYPGIGPKTAERLAIFTATKLSKDNLTEFSNNLNLVRDEIHQCPNCGLITDKDICSVCSDADRVNTLIVVEDSKDVLSFEALNTYKGKYHVLGGCISPMRGIGPNDINIEALKERVERENIKEVILSLSSTLEGETTSIYISELLKNYGCEVYKIGYGLPVGASIEYIDENTLLKALEGKRKI